MNFTYTGPNSAITLKLADGTERDVLLFTGRDVELPAEHDAVKALQAQQLLVPPRQDGLDGQASGEPN